MLGVPSIVMGLFIFTVITLHFKTLNGFAGSLALACLILPIVIRTSEEMLHLVPEELREGSYALGSRRVRTIRTVVLPNAAPGIVSGALLAVARAAGETAPLLFVIGTVTAANHNLFNGPNTTLSVQIFHGATSPFVGAQDHAYAAALTLVLLTFVFTGLARLVTTSTPVDQPQERDHGHHTAAGHPSRRRYSRARLTRPPAAQSTATGDGAEPASARSSSG